MERVDVFIEPARAFLVQIAAYLPRLGVALLIVIAGWLIAKAARFAIVKALRAINVHVLTRRAGIDGFLEQGGIESDSVDLLGWIAYWSVILMALVIAFNGLGLEYITALLTRVLSFIPRLVLAIVILTIGLYFGRFVADALTAYFRNIEVRDADLLGRLAQYGVVVFVVLIALDLLDIGGSVVHHAFLIVLGGVMLAFALAFGLGGQGWAAALLERWWPTQRRLLKKGDEFDGPDQHS